MTADHRGEAVPPAGVTPPPGPAGSIATRSLEDLAFERLEVFLARLQGRRVPELYQVVMKQVERALLRAALGQTRGHLSRAAALLDMDRNRLSQKARALGIPVSGRPGPKRREKKPAR